MVGMPTEATSDAAADDAEGHTDHRAADDIGGVVDAHVGAADADDRGDAEPQRRRPCGRPSRQHHGREDRRTGVAARERRRARLANG